MRCVERALRPPCDTARAIAARRSRRHPPPSPLPRAPPQALRSGAAARLPGGAGAAAGAPQLGEDDVTLVLEGVALCVSRCGAGGWLVLEWWRAPVWQLGGREGPRCADPPPWRTHPGPSPRRSCWGRASRHFWRPCSSPCLRLSPPSRRRPRAARRCASGCRWSTAPRPSSAPSTPPPPRARRCGGARGLLGGGAAAWSARARCMRASSPRAQSHPSSPRSLPARAPQGVALPGRGLHSGAGRRRGPRARVPRAAVRRRAPLPACHPLHALPLAARPA